MTAISSNLFDSCRLCLSNTEKKIYIFKQENGDMFDEKLSVKIYLCLSIEVQKDDSLPMWICHRCKSKIEDIYEYRKLCLSSNAMLRAALNEPLVKVKEELPEEHDIVIKEESLDEYGDSCLIPMYEEEKVSDISESELPCSQDEEEVAKSTTLENDITIPPVQVTCQDSNERLLWTSKKNFKRYCCKTRMNLQCPWCSRQYSYQAAYDKHTTECCSKTQEKFDRFVRSGGHPCRVCKLVFEKPAARDYHERTTHSTVGRSRLNTTFPCPDCSEVFTKKGDLICHQAKHHRAKINQNINRLQLWTCEKCGLQFLHKREYVVHKEFCIGAAVPLYVPACIYLGKPSRKGSGKKSTILAGSLRKKL